MLYHIQCYTGALLYAITTYYKLFHLSRNWQQSRWRGLWAATTHCRQPEGNNSLVSEIRLLPLSCVKLKPQWCTKLECTFKALSSAESPRARWPGPWPRAFRCPEPGDSDSDPGVTVIGPPAGLCLILGLQGMPSCHSTKLRSKTTHAPASDNEISTKADI